MTFDEAFEKLKAQFPHANLEKQDTKPDPSVKVAAEHIVEVLRYLKDQLQFETLANLGGLDYPKLPALCVFYHPFSYTHKLSICLKVYLPRQTGQRIPTVCGIYKAANWLERETYDMFGTEFSDHPDLRRILCPEDWVGYPLLKDYSSPDYYQGMPVPLYFEDKVPGGENPS